MLVKKQFRFEAAHILPRHPGKCANLHGHSWILEVEVHGKVKKETGFVLDFYDLGQLVQPIVDRFDHRLLNAYVRYPSSENIAIHVAHELYNKLFGFDIFNKGYSRLVVRVSETAKTWAAWDSDDSVDCNKVMYDTSDSDWRSPDTHYMAGVAITKDLIEKIGKNASQATEAMIDAHIQRDQLRLYLDTVDDHPDIPKPMMDALLNGKNLWPAE